MLATCADPEGGEGVQTPPLSENHKNIGFLCETGPDPLKITKLQSPHSMLGHHMIKRHLTYGQYKNTFQYFAREMIAQTRPLHHFTDWSQVSNN